MRSEAWNRWLFGLTLCAVALAQGGDTRATEAESEGCHVQGDRGSYRRSLESLALPSLTLLNQDGRSVDVRALLETDHPVAVTFVFTTCTTICPVMTSTFRRMRDELDSQPDDLQLVSISIDPEYDRPEVLREYSRRYDFGDRWEFLTGETAQITTLLKAFNAYYGDKMNHRPLYFFKRPGEPEWLRLEGLLRGSDMANEFRELLSN